MQILFPKESFNRSIDFEFQDEEEAAHEIGFTTSLYDQENFRIRGDKVPSLFRGWIVTPEDYRELGENAPLVVTPEEYEYGLLFPNWYRDLKGHTPDSIWFPEAPEDLEEQVRKHFGNKPVILKDYVKSHKHKWLEACYIPRASDSEHVKKVVQRFLELQQYNTVNVGLVFREFVTLDYIGVHVVSGTPIANEYRIFVYNKIPFFMAPYWDSSEVETPIYLQVPPPPDVVDTILPLVKSPFYAVDVARTEEGSWIVIEINEGGSAQIPVGQSYQKFYRALKGVISGDLA